MVDILFSNPPWWVSRQPITLSRAESFGLSRAGVRAGSRWPFTLRTSSTPDNPKYGEYLPYPFFLGFAAAYAKNQGLAVAFRDSIALRDSYETYFAYIKTNKPRWIVIESATPSWSHDSLLIAELGMRFPALKVILTGPISNSNPWSESPGNLVAVISGEYEKTVVKVIQGEITGNVPSDLLTTEEMNQAPFMFLDEYHAYRYFDASPKGSLFPQLQVWASRGCPYKCIFCVWPATMTGNDPDGRGKRTVRHYSSEYIRANLCDTLSRFPRYRSIYFDDDTFNLGDRHVLSICEVMAEIKLPWTAMCRADTITQDVWRRMKETGCVGVKLGFESGSQYVVDKIVNKYLDLREAAETVRFLKSIGLTIHGTFTYGLPGETREQMLETKMFIQSLPFDSVQESGTAEIEGTPLHRLRLEGTLKRYAGASIDSEYSVMVDGQEKARKLLGQLKT
jgi:radical SAM superfamily enzyme YgiQ (UPF0313 family)